MRFSGSLYFLSPLTKGVRGISSGFFVGRSLLAVACQGECDSDDGGDCGGDRGFGGVVAAAA